MAADINSDGKLDLITANYDESLPPSIPGTLTVLTNNGSGVFGSNATLTVGKGSICIVAADINGDGKLDLISANFIASTLTVLTNNGSGIFGSNATINVVNGGPRSVVAADVNGDGKLDLIYANSFNGMLTVLTNAGNGIFGSNVTINVGSNPQCVIAADVNGDCHVDLISANVNDNTLTVLTQILAGPPALTITSTDSNTVAILWSTLASGFALQTNSDLTTSNWGTSGFAISTNGPIESVTIPPQPAGNLFFRLKQ